MSVRILLFGALGALVLRVHGADYTYTKLAETGPDSPFASVASLAISSNGIAAIGAVRKDGINVAYTTTGGALTPVIDTSGELQAGFVNGVNSSGTIVMVATLDDNSTGVFTAFGGKLTPVYKGADIQLMDVAFINDKGTVVYAIGNGQIGGSRIEISSGGAIRKIAESTGAFAGLVLRLGQINNQGQVAFIAAPLVSLNNPGTIYTAGERPPAPAMPPTPSVGWLAFKVPAINDRGVIVFDALVDAAVQSILLVEGGKVRTVVSAPVNPPGPFRSVAFPNINNNGTVAFYANGNPGQPRAGIYTGPDPVRDKVIAAGDALFGSTVADVQVGQTPANGSRFLSEQGHVLFTYALQDGRIGAALATPTGVTSSGSAPGLPGTGIVNAASFLASSSVARGELVTIFGTGVASGAATPAAPYPTTLQGTSVTFNGIKAPILYVSQMQVNVQVPYELKGDSVEVRIINGFGESPPRTLDLAAASPGIYAHSEGQGMIFLANSITIAAPESWGALARPAQAGDVLTVYVNGMGAVDPPIASGMNSCGGPPCAENPAALVLRRTVARPVVEIGGVRVLDENILFSGLAPEYVGLYQVNFVVPAGLPKGDAVPIVIRQAGVFSQPNVTLAVR